MKDRTSPRGKIFMENIRQKKIGKSASRRRSWSWTAGLRRTHDRRASVTTSGQWMVGLALHTSRISQVLRAAWQRDKDQFWVIDIAEWLRIKRTYAEESENIVKATCVKISTRADNILNSFLMTIDYHLSPSFMNERKRTFVVHYTNLLILLLN